ncbi:hypothetical protein HGRIS_011198 [Hohenbuehelia grisea]|uniref:ATP-dependent RNA helicase n=1 Tax=Hohenbuehelia grisea TaxID=104357 RepID=A0ABR3JWJ2_9AGAR
MSTEYRTKVMDQFRKGDVRILICSDAAGMGCNVPKVRCIVQWKLPGTLSAFIQREGRAARGADCEGIAILLVEKSAYNIIISEATNHSQKASQANAEGSKTAKAAKEYAKAHGVQRGSYYGGDDDAVIEKRQPHLNLEADDEGLLVFVQTGRCLREVLCAAYGNEVPSPSIPCCDVCDPGLLEKTRPAPPASKGRQSNVRRGLPAPRAQDALDEWRRKIHRRDFAGALFAPDGILPDATIDLLSSVGQIASRAKLDRVLAARWCWLSRYGNELLEMLCEMDIPFIPRPKKAHQKSPGRWYNRSRSPSTLSGQC